SGGQRKGERDREGRRKALCSSPPPPPPRLAERGRAERRRDQPLPSGEATPARRVAGGSRREEGAQEKRCIETFRANFGESARNRASAARVPACPGAGRAAADGRRCGARTARRRGPGGGGAAAERALGPAERPPKAAAGAGGEPGLWRGETGDPEEEPPFPRSPSQRPAGGTPGGGGGHGGGAGESAAGRRRRRGGGEAERGGPRSAACAGNHELSADLDPLGAGGAPLSAERGVIKFLEVYERSFCRTIETLVDIFQEYPDEVEYIFKPSCVPLMRCAGCCGDEGLECVPVDVYNVTMEIMRIKPHQSQHIAHMSFLQHSKCDCRPKKDVKNKQEKWAQKPRSDGPSFIRQTWSLHDARPWQSFLMLYPESGKSRRVCPTRMDSSHCEPCSERRKHLFVQDPQTCKCSCKFTDSRCKSRQLELNERTCRCEKPRR
uniref:Vascular endothelial growth factor A n=1 Tax=Aquila chrysaetos chrysaetos TaxID=223781 RepID=A0A663E6B6_AQUCH